MIPLFLMNAYVRLPFRMELLVDLKKHRKKRERKHEHIGLETKLPLVYKFLWGFLMSTHVRLPLPMELFVDLKKHRKKRERKHENIGLETILPLVYKFL